MSNFGRLDASLQTDIGQQRPNNQDHVKSWEPSNPEEENKHGWLYIVADGVGGADAGEFASQYACEQTIQHYLENESSTHWGQRIIEAMKMANTDLRQYIANNAENSRMATTMVATVLKGPKAFIGNVGDSRAYHWRKGQIRQITRDQSLVAKLVEEGAIPKEEAKGHPHENIILFSIGSDQNPQIDLYEIDLQINDKIVLCSDGLTRHVEDEEIATMLSTGGSREVGSKLIRLANERGGKDNISVGILHYRPTAQEVQEAEKSANAPVKVVPNANVNVQTAVSRRTLSILTTALSLVQTILIFSVWFWLRV